MISLNRRNFIRLTSASLSAACLPNTIAQSKPDIATPHPRQAAWQDLELGLVYHFDLHVYMPGGHHHERSRREKLSARLYNPKKLDTDQWLAAAKAMGCKYAIFTATHHQGFLQWQSDLYPFGVKQAPWRRGKGDVVKDFIESCQRVGIKPGIYIGIRFNAYWDVYQYKVNGGKGGNPEKQKKYVEICEKIVEELCTRYGDWIEVWFDGGVLTPEEGGPDVLPIVERTQPDTIFYHSKERADHRWAGSESGTTEYPCWSTLPSVDIQKSAHTDPKLRTQLLKHGDPNGSVWCPAWCDAPIRNHHWFWVPDTEDDLYSLDALMNMYEKSVGRNGNLMLGAIPNRDGLIPEIDFNRYVEFGREIRRRYGKPIIHTPGSGKYLVMNLPHRTHVNQITIMEDIVHSERIREYKVQGLLPNQSWKNLCEGTSVGHKRIQRFDSEEVEKLRLVVSKSIENPLIRDFAVYSI